MPTYSPCSLCPVNHRDTDNRKEIPAAAKKSALALFILSGLLIIFFLIVVFSVCVSGSTFDRDHSRIFKI
jgi:hypothetical protein